ncbi:hypothetical protein EIN_319670 [Entamoeba invadens IP1]|uniref:Ricin B lectin domain-containing protein n=1 Tax=Entamoeba invadens IP1 TaxID=370355 RepID=A0A0A1U2Y2_ENTIV|nr:hypothetical protein EIN_319670 [Entamoeba invadens IP1]ELP87028.1 hypothetical protein EIN_319670 [Entamoeba invadens IP1]|eukprot:XP_004253799.1 hypothetical protein EIN_319670 [Entamoeba invadens IP1]
MANEARVIKAYNNNVVDISKASLDTGARAILFRYHGGENQLFFVDQSIGWIISVFSRLALTADEQGKITQQRYCGLSRQQWVFEPVNDKFIIRLFENPVQCLTATNESEICLSSYTNSPNQLWLIQ